ncbi:MAG: hypothetical protein HXY43_06775 [Fischerella sp.]|uniref:hypothetical protein n=1 Tax=Fischerella sp. TaxID=1191 RepID=UPI00183E3E64|nr:hypothetical protein [Fischerella sp.]NWF59003.1 hypothetical protein [Fischerella sp.]
MDEQKNNVPPENSSTEQNNDPINNNDHPITAGFKFFSYLVDSPERMRRMLQFGRTILIFIWLLALTILMVVRPNKITVGNLELNAGTITLQEDNNTTKKTFILNPNGGGFETPWVDTQITVKKGDKVTINASGKINLAVGRLIRSAKDDVILMTPWSDPDGIPKHLSDDPDYPEIKNFKVMKEQPFGKLIAGVQGSDDSITSYAIGKEKVFTMQKDGKLLLTRVSSSNLV